VSAHVGLYAGTFDPVTNGHLDVLRRAASIVDRLVVAVSRSGRATHFTAAERAAFLRAELASVPNVVVDEFDGLVVDHAKKHGARVLFRGLRGARDLDAETEMGWANACLSGLETAFLVASPRTARISSSLVREVAALGGDVSAWVPPAVAAALRANPPRRR
jgi:pantetheine-phosphate adenylyltransferase